MPDQIVSERRVRPSKILFFNSLNRKFYHTLEVLDSSGLRTGDLELTSKEAPDPMFCQSVVSRDIPPKRAISKSELSQYGTR